MRSLRYWILPWLIITASGCQPPMASAPAQPDTGAPPARIEPAQPAPAAELQTRETRPWRDAGGLVKALPAQALTRRPAAAHPMPTPGDERERYAVIDGDTLRRVAEAPVSTFSLDVDTGSYANVRRMLQAGRLPPADAVRVEELINYFDYADPLPGANGAPFSLSTEIGPNPWNPRTRLLRIGIRAPALARGDLPPANLVFLVDVSGSMQAADKLPLLQASLKLLIRHLDARDRVSLVVYAGSAGLVLPPTPGDRRATLIQALAQLRAGGSTNGGAGIQLAYAQAREAYIEGGINRVILATDGDFNVGTVDQAQLLDLVERQRAAGIALTTLGFGQGNYNDALMEQLADHGDGNHGYIDGLLEAQKLLVDELGATLHTVAGDVKVQVEFNPALVSEYRLIGYENRTLAREDFTNDRVDAGEIGAGHTLTALYELALHGEGGERSPRLRYAPVVRVPASGLVDELAHIRLRYKRPGEVTSRLIEQPLLRQALHTELAHTSDDFRFAAAVAAFGQWLRSGTYLEGMAPETIAGLAAAARGADSRGLRGDFLGLVRLAQGLSAAAATAQ